MKKILALAVCLLILVQFAACTGNSVQNTEKTETSLQGITDLSDFADYMESSGFVPEVSFIDISEDAESKAESDESEKTESGETSNPEEPDDVSLPEENVPDESESETSAPEVTVPEVSVPEVSEPDESEPDENKPQYDYTSGQKHTALKNTQRYLYSILDSQQKEWYMKIDAAVNALENEVDLDAEILDGNNYYIYYLYAFDNPEHFYLGNEISVYTDGVSEYGIYLSYSDGKTHSSYDYGEMTEALKSSIRAKKSVFDAEVSRIASTIPADAPDVVKELLIYDYILTVGSYNMSATWSGPAPDPWSAYGIIIDHTGVCESYAEAFQTLCFAVGINCTGIEGYAGEEHKWNAVCLDGEWYMCDITFDDPIGGLPGAAYHDHFNLTSAQMQAKDHTVIEEYVPVPVCNGTKYSYANYFGN